MDPLVVGVVGVFVMFVLMALGMSIGVAMAVVGFVGFAYVVSWDAAVGLLKTVPYSSAANYALSVVPLFVLMGQFAFSSGLSRELYFVCYRWLGHLPGGLAMATIGGCAGFAAICGSSPATAATMGTVALPEMKKYNYHPSLATGSIAAGGTLGILIPPSVGFVIYGIITENSIGKLLLAGVVPGVVLTLLYMIAIYLVVRNDPSKGPAGPKVSFSEKIKALKDVWGILTLFLVVIGGMFVGLFTATEAAAVGAFGAFLFLAFRGKLTWETLKDCLLGTGRTTAMIFVILIGAYIFGYFLTVTKIATSLAEFISTLPVPSTLILISILIVYIILGCIMDALAMILLTVPIFYPVITSLGFDPIWFGVIMVVVMEQALITPPVGMNVYVIGGVAKDVPLDTIFKGVIPFWLAIMVFLAILIAVPQLALFLPNIMR
ncbi:C4-dicarboxylate ABC transporter permease [Clostridiales bacterium PH28_bin88]|nr:C4-dicarboxylate ABC transporter permease [Clostridiales bacterium PH28_bin88]